MIADIQSGKIDPKQEVMQRMTNINPVQRLALQAAMPMLGKVGKKFGATDDDIQAIKQALHF